MTDYINNNKSTGRILVIGASGLVGSYFCRLRDLHLQYNVFAASHSEPVRAKSLMPSIETVGLDISGPLDRIWQTITSVNPDVIVNLAAMTNVDLCESERELADRVNHLFVKQLAQFIRKNPECFILHVSTDYVFDGERGNYSEDDETNPLGWYGMTKLMGEKELVNCDSANWCIARTSTPFGIHEKKQSFPVFVAKNLTEGKPVNVLTDQKTSPTYCQNLAEMLFELVTNKVPAGIIHLSGSSKLSRFDQAIKIVDELGLEKELIKPTKMSEMVWKAKRPKDSTLNIEKASRLLANKPMDFDQSLRDFLKEYKAQKH